MKKLLFISILLLTSCSTSTQPESNCDSISAEYVQFISYQDFSAHKFQNGQNIYFYTSEFDGVIGNSYDLCLSNDKIESIK